MHKKGIIIKYPVEPQKLKHFISGIVFMLAVGGILLFSNEPWNHKKNEQNRKACDERVERFRTEEIDEFLQNCNIEYSLDITDVHEINLDELAGIIKTAVRDYEPLGRSRFFGKIVFSGKVGDEAFEVALKFSDNTRYGYSSFTISGRQFSSPQLKEWSQKNFPEAFKRIEENNAKRYKHPLQNRLLFLLVLWLPMIFFFISIGKKHM